MKRNFNIPMKGFGGVPITETVKNADGTETVKEVNLASKLGMRLFYAGSEKPNPQSPSAMILSDDEKIRCYHLAVQLAEHPGEVELTTNDGTLIKKIASADFVAGIYGQIYDIIENE